VRLLQSNVPPKVTQDAVVLASLASTNTTHSGFFFTEHEEVGGACDVDHPYDGEEPVSRHKKWAGCDRWRRESWLKDLISSAALPPATRQVQLVRPDRRLARRWDFQRQLPEENERTYMWKRSPQGYYHRQGSGHVTRNKDRKKRPQHGAQHEHHSCLVVSHKNKRQ